MFPITPWCVGGSQLCKPAECEKFHVCDEIEIPPFSTISIPAPLLSGYSFDRTVSVECPMHRSYVSNHSMVRWRFSALKAWMMPLQCKRTFHLSLRRVTNDFSAQAVHPCFRALQTYDSHLSTDVERSTHAFQRGVKSSTIIHVIHVVGVARSASEPLQCLIT